MIRKILLISFLFLTIQTQAQVSGLSDWTIFIDPGHSQTENMGIYNYSEAEKVLRIGLYLRHLLQTKTDIAAVYLSRNDDQDQVSLSQRSSMANSLDTDWYHSIHSNAPSSTSNTTLLLHGGWRSNGVTVEKTPKGGKRMSDIMVPIYTRAMRTNTLGNYADRTFYQGFPDNHANQFPYLHVNRETNMASELSEGGYHTNPVQNTRNMNADWKKIEAYAIFWTILKYHGLQRPQVNIATGFVYNAESHKPLNGAVISINDTSYITDTYESLFYKYSNNPQQLANGFYFLDGFDQDSVEINVSAPDYIPQKRTVALSDTFFTFADFNLISTLPPFVASTLPVQADTNVLSINTIQINFSRPMNTASVENNFSITPWIAGSFSWDENDQQLTFNTFLDFLTEYTVTIDSLAEDKYAHKLDGNADSLAGDNFVLTFKTGFDAFAPHITAIYPENLQEKISLQPIISYQYNEVIDQRSVNDDPIQLINFLTEETIEGQLYNYTVNDRTVFNFIPSEKLQSLTVYTTEMQSGLSDLFGNISSVSSLNYFRTADYDLALTGIASFNDAFTDNWWQPAGSGNTIGIAENTEMFASDSIVNPLTASSQSMCLQYDWNLASKSWLIREYLSGGASRSITFDTSYKLQVYLFGDGSNTKFRFALDEDSTSGTWPNHEVSVWFTVDWIGWKLVEWDLSDPQMVGAWLGNGKLDGTRYRIDSFQLTYNNSDVQGRIYFDDLRLVKEMEIVNIEKNIAEIPKSYHLGQNYPNPFNPSTKVDYWVAAAGQLKIDVYNSLGQHVAKLIDGYRPAGRYSLVFDASGYAAGTYILRMHINNKTFMQKMTLLK